MPVKWDTEPSNYNINLEEKKTIMYCLSEQRKTDTKNKFRRHEDALPELPAQETEAGGSWDEYKASLSYIMRHCLEKPKPPEWALAMLAHHVNSTLRRLEE